MASAKTQSPQVSVNQTPEGGLELGVTLEQVFVPLLTVDSARLGQLLEAAHNRAGDAGGDEEGSEE